MKDFPVVVGFLAAFIHVISGPDHLAAVTPLAIEEEKNKWKIGWWWGWGHLTGMLLIGMFLALIKTVYPVEIFGKYSEKLVGVLLIFLGLWVLWKLYNKTRYNDKRTSQRQNGRKGKNYAFGFGVVHGFAGITHFLLMLPVLTFGKWQIIGYLLGFGLGTLAAMSLFAALTGWLAIKMKRYFYLIRLIAGVIAMIVGIYWIIL